MKGRSIHEPDVDDELGNENIELVVEPNLNTQHKRVQQTPNWGKIVNERANVDESKILQEETGVTEGQADAHTYIHTYIHTYTRIDIHILV